MSPGVLSTRMISHTLNNLKPFSPFSIFSLLPRIPILENAPPRGPFYFSAPRPFSSLALSLTFSEVIHWCTIQLPSLPPDYVKPHFLFIAVPYPSPPAQIILAFPGTNPPEDGAQPSQDTPLPSALKESRRSSSPPHCPPPVIASRELIHNSRSIFSD